MALVAEGERDVVPTARLLSWVFLLGYVLVTAVGRSVYAAHGRPPSGLFEVLAGLGLLTFIWNWVRRECEVCGATFPEDFAWFLAMLWFLLVPYYMWHLQRWKGLLKCAVVCAWYLGAWAVGTAVYYAVVEAQ